MPWKRFPIQAYLPKQMRKNQLDNLELDGPINEDLGWNRYELHPSEMMEVMKDCEVWRHNLELLSSQPPQKSKR